MTARIMSRVDLKVVLLGKEAGGKTSLVERYVHHRFIERMTPYQATIGAAYASKKVEINGNQVTLGVWDTAGSERYEAMSRMYYRNARAAIVCFDLTDETSFDRAKFWISEINKNEENCKIYLCGTKCDLIQSDPTLRRINAQTINNYGSAIGATYHETSSKTGQGVDQLFDKISSDYVYFNMLTDFGTSSIINPENSRKKSYCCFR